MRKNSLALFVTAIVLAFVFVLKPVPQVFAQEAGHEDTAFEKAYKEYQKQVEEYQAAHADYVLRRSQYLRFKTLQSQQDARGSTIKMMQERDDVLIFYFDALKERLKEAIGLEDSRKSAIYVKIDQEVGWLKDHRARIESAGTLNDLVVDNKNAKARYLIEEPLFYEVLATVSSGKIADFDERLKDVFDQLKLKIDEIKGEQREEYKLSDEKLASLDRWVLEADLRITRAEEKLSAGDNSIGTLITAAQRKQQPLGAYNTIMLSYSEAQQFLKEAGSYLREIVREIKTSDN